METCTRRRIYIVRHGEVDYFAASSLPVDPVLTLKGIQQSLSTARFIAAQEVKIDRVVTSSYVRAKKTAEIIIGELKQTLSPVIESSFREISAGDVTALSAEALRASCFVGMYQVPLSSKFMNGERIEDFTARVNNAMDHLLADQSWNNLLIVAHGGVNTALLSRALTGADRSYIATIEQDYACLNILEVGSDGKGWVVRLVNYTHEWSLSKSRGQTTMERFLQGYETKHIKNQ
jgi:phosphoserine phosphatase